jgi:hypothetical protein
MFLFGSLENAVGTCNLCILQFVEVLFSILSSMKFIKHAFLVVYNCYILTENGEHILYANEYQLFRPATNDVQLYLGEVCPHSQFKGKDFLRLEHLHRRPR